MRFYLIGVFFAVLLIPTVVEADPPPLNVNPSMLRAVMNGDAHPVKAWDGETPEQHTRRVKQVMDVTNHIRDIVDKNNKERTPEERRFIQAYWRRVMRILRISELAETENDTEIVARAKRLLEKVDAFFFDKLADMNAKAPTNQANP